MERNFDRCLRYVLEHEGGYVHHPGDPPNSTNMGISLYVYQRHFGKPRTIDDLHWISYDRIRAIYMLDYWGSTCCDDLPDGLDYAVFDMAVHSGKNASVELLQRVLGVTADGVIGDVTLNAIQQAPVLESIDWFCTSRLERLRSIRSSETLWTRWVIRVSSVRKRSISMWKEAKSV